MTSCARHTALAGWRAAFPRTRTALVAISLAVVGCIARLCGILPTSAHAASHYVAHPVVSLPKLILPPRLLPTPGSRPPTRGVAAASAARHSTVATDLSPLAHEHPHGLRSASILALVSATATAAGIAWGLLRRPRPARPQPVDTAWRMAHVTAASGGLDDFGADRPPDAPYPGLADMILERRAPGGVPSNSDDVEVGYRRSDLAARLALQYLPLDLDCPGMRVRSVDPPVLTIEGFLTDDDCDALMAHSPDLLQRSTVAAGDMAQTGGLTESLTCERRTSSSVLVDDDALHNRTGLAAPIDALQARAKALFPGAVWGPRGRLPQPGTICFESLQIARYESGQHFLEHQDGYPFAAARRNRFQRLATILVYLNDVPAGGTTAFRYLDLVVTPRKGTALVFLPGFRDGRPDNRMLHEARAAIAEKWVAQQWVAVGLAVGVPSSHD